METKLRDFLEQYIGQGADKSDTVTREAVEDLLLFAASDYDKGLSEKILAYGRENPDAPFWDFLAFVKPGLDGITQEELLAEDDE